MNPTGLMEMAQVKEQESMREALRQRALREARKQAGVTWIQVIRARLFGARGVVTTPAAAAAPAMPPSSSPVVQNSVPPTTNTRPLLVHEIRIRQHTAPPSGSVAQSSGSAPNLRVVEPAELDCVAVDC